MTANPITKIGKFERHLLCSFIPADGSDPVWCKKVNGQWVEIGPLKAANNNTASYGGHDVA